MLCNILPVCNEMMEEVKFIDNNRAGPSGFDLCSCTRGLR